MTSYPEHVHLILQSMESDEPAARDPGTLTRTPIDLVAGRNWVVTVHDGPVRAFERIDASTEGESRLGALDAAGFKDAKVAARFPTEGNDDPSYLDRSTPYEEAIREAEDRDRMG